MRTKALAAFSLVMIASIVLAACGGPATPAVAAPKVLRTGEFLSGDVPTIDPSLSTDTSSVQVVDEISVGLTRQNEVTAGLEPGMATSWDVSADGLTYTFHLRTDVPWVKYDGAQGKVVKVQDDNGADRMVTAKDFEYAILRTLDPKTASDYAYVLTFAIKGAADYNGGTSTDPATVGVKALDDATLQITFNQPAVYNANIAGMWVAHAEPKWLIDAKGPRWTETGFQQSYGPYTLKEWVHDASMTLIKNPFWPGSDSVPQAKIDEIVFSMTDEPVSFAAYEAGDLDVSPVPLTEIDRIKADATLSKQFTINPYLCTYWYGFNTKAPVVNDVRVRLALSESVDRASLIANVTKGGQEPAQWLARPGLGGAPTMKDHPDLGVKYDPTDAKAQLQSYLTEKGMTADQLDLTLMFNTSAGHQKIAEAIQQMWKTNLGINVKVVNQEWKVYLKTILDPVATPQIFRLGWCQDYPDANNFDKEAVGFGGSENPSGGGGLNWKNDQYEALIEQAARETDPTKRVDLYAQAEQILVKTDAVLIPIYWYTTLAVTKPYVTRTYSVLGGLEHFEKWDISKK